MLIPTDLIKKFNLNCDKKINKLNNRKSFLMKAIFIILLILFLSLIIKNQNKILA